LNQLIHQLKGGIALTTAEVKTELNKAKIAEHEYHLAQEKAINFRSKLTGKGVRYDRNDCTNEHSGNTVEMAYCTLADYEAESDRLFNAMLDAKRNAEQIIRKVNDPIQREVLTRRYIIVQKWEDIAEAMNYSERRVRQIHSDALKNISLYFRFFL
jgi:DNA-directed RNA polymerase specialized sigma subunit